MKITRVSGVVYRQQLKSGGPQPKFAGEGRTAFETLLVKVETDAGIVGWGEAFPHRIWKAVKSLLETLIAPACIGADPTDISGLMKMLIYRVHGVGRAGPVMYALSGVDIALWDILGKTNNQPIYKLLGGTPSGKLPAYASLLKYADTDVVVRTCEEALGRGYRDLKVHETGRDEITAATNLLRRHNGGSLMVDVNAPWTLQEALAAVAPLRELGVKWIEEPVWPPALSASLESTTWACMRESARRGGIISRCRTTITYLPPTGIFSSRPAVTRCAPFASSIDANALILFRRFLPLRRTDHANIAFTAAAMLVSVTRYSSSRGGE